MHGRAEEKTVKTAGYGKEFIDAVIENAMFQLRALVAAKAAGERFCSNPEHFSSDAFLLQCFPGFIERRKGAAVLMRASIDENNFHFEPLS